MRHFAVLCLLISLGGAAAILLGQQPAQIRVDVEAVNVLVTVTDKKGRFVTELSRDRFRIFEEGKEQEITNFSQETDLPLQVALLIDTSASVRPKLEFEKQAAVTFISSVMRPDDKALLVEFDSGVSLISDYTSKPELLIRQIRGLKAGGGTSLLDAVYTVALEKMSGGKVRKTIVLVSDGADRNSTRSADEALDMVQRSGTAVYVIGTNRFGASSDRKGEKILDVLSEETGGRAFYPYSPELLETAFEEINDELRSQYSLTYTPSERKGDKKFRKIKVSLKNGKNLTLRYRKGYFVPGLSTVSPSSSTPD